MMRSEEFMADEARVRGAMAEMLAEKFFTSDREVAETTYEEVFDAHGAIHEMMGTTMAAHFFAKLTQDEDKLNETNEALKHLGLMHLAVEQLDLQMRDHVRKLQAGEPTDSHEEISEEDLPDLEGAFEAALADDPSVPTPEEYDDMDLTADLSAGHGPSEEYLRAAAHVLWVEDYREPGVMEPGSFTLKLIQAWQKADTMNKLRLAQAFPVYGAVIQTMGRPGGSALLLSQVKPS
jgi:hypothetical protein